VKREKRRGRDWGESVEEERKRHARKEEVVCLGRAEGFWGERKRIRGGKRNAPSPEKGRETFGLVKGGRRGRGEGGWQAD